MFNQIIRPRRLRTSDNLRRMVRETRISADSLIWPIFIAETIKKNKLKRAFIKIVHLEV